jgi:DNA-binding NarL/FixJ family response regulator
VINIDVDSAPSSGPLRVLLADDHPLLRKAIRSVLESQTDFQVIAEASDGLEAVKLASELVPDVVIMDISMPKLNGIEATKKIKAENPKIAVLVLTVHDDIEHVVGILEAGAAGYLTKNAFDKEIVQAIKAIGTGEAVFSPEVFREIFKYTVRYPIKPVPLEAGGNLLSSREMETLKLVARGMSNKEIAETLKIGLRTVKGHLVVIFSKLTVGSRTEAIVNGLRTGFLTLDDLL